MHDLLDRLLRMTDRMNYMRAAPDGECYGYGYYDCWKHVYLCKKLNQAGNASAL